MGVLSNKHEKLSRYNVYDVYVYGSRGLNQQITLKEI